MGQRVAWEGSARRGDVRLEVSGMLGMFSRAAAGGNLSPVERALLRFLTVALNGALLSGAQAALPLLSSANPAAVPWVSVAHTFLAAFLLALWLGVAKYHTAQGDAPLPVGDGLPQPVVQAVRQP